MRNSFKIFGIYFILAIIGIISIPLGWPNNNRYDKEQPENGQFIWRNVGMSIGYFYLTSLILFLIFLFVDYIRNKE